MENCWEVVSGQSCLLGESPIWDQASKSIYWVDILPGDIHQHCISSQEHKVTNAGQMVGAIALKRNGGLIAALQRGFAFIDFETGSVTMLVDPEDDVPGNRFNDGKCDPGGRFWAGTMDAKEKKIGAGSLYVLNRDLSVSVQIKNVTCSNGLAWSPDHKKLYFIDTPTRSVAAYDYDVRTGLITNRKVVIEIPETDGYPDGMTIDTDGMLWIACWDGWKISRWNPVNGKLLMNVFLPVSRVTSCIFGGEALEDLYITTAKTGLSENDLKTQPLAGCLFVIRNSGFRGVPVAEFDWVN